MSPASLGTVTVQRRSAYGLHRIYPVNGTARLFARLAGRKTLLEADLEVICALGYVIDWIPESAGTTTGEE